MSLCVKALQINFSFALHNPRRPGRIVKALPQDGFECVAMQCGDFADAIDELLDEAARSLIDEAMAPGEMPPPPQGRLI